MKIEQYIQRIQQIDNMIRCRRTGSPGELARRMGISESTLYKYISFMRDSGAPIAYSKKSQTYYYEHRVEFSYGFSIKEKPMSN